MHKAIVLTITVLFNVLPFRTAAQSPQASTFSSSKRQFTFCFLTKAGEPRVYLSDVFPVDFVNRENLFTTAVPEFRSYLAEKYSDRELADGHRGSFGCHDGWATEAEATAHKNQEIVRYRANPASAEIVESRFIAKLHSANRAISPIMVRPDPKTNNPKPSSGGLLASGLNTTGLVNQRVIDDLYQGKFADINFDRDNTSFLVLFEMYLESFARECANALPSSKVEMTEQVCRTKRTLVNKYGGQVGPSSCGAWDEQGTGLYADPTLYSAKRKLDNLVASNALHESLRVMSQKNPFETAANLDNEIRRYRTDMQSLVKLNACGNSGLKRFEQNVALFSAGKPPISLSGATAARPVPGNNQDYKRFADDLITSQSRTWIMNRYTSGGVNNAEVITRDAAGRPAKLLIGYRFNSRDVGSVTIEFSDGLPECMYFFDQPNSCKIPDRNILGAFMNGSYGR